MPPLAATQDTSGGESQNPCPVLQPAAQPAWSGGILHPPSSIQAAGWSTAERETKENEGRDKVGEQKQALRRAEEDEEARTRDE